MLDGYMNKSLFSDIRFRFSFLTEMWHYFRLLCKFNASVAISDNPEKMRYLIARESHVFEKALSLKNTRKGFGKEKAINLISHIERYVGMEGCKYELLNYSVNILDRYVAHLQKEGDGCADLKERVELLKSAIGYRSVDAGIAMIAGEEINQNAKGDFKSLLKSRHSIRYFSTKPVEDGVITEALEMARFTPSACNRQSWKTHIYRDDAAKSIIKWQGGAKGAEDHIHCAILVTADLRAFFAHEPFQVYIDGGLYAMNLINALHFCGLGTLPLSCGYPAKKLRELRRFEIPYNEVPIVIIATGYIEDNVKIAVSGRLPVDLTNTYHDKEK